MLMIGMNWRNIPKSENAIVNLATFYVMGKKRTSPNGELRRHLVISNKKFEGLHLESI